MADKIYKIVDFNKDLGQITVMLDSSANVSANVSLSSFGSFVIDLHPTPENTYITGDDLDSYIKGFIPYYEIERRSKIPNVTNVSDIEALVTPIPQVITANTGVDLTANTGVDLTANTTDHIYNI